jgi:hypothetical protein
MWSAAAEDGVRFVRADAAQRRANPGDASGTSAAKKDDVGNRVVLSAAASPFPWVREVTQGISRSFKYSDHGTS